MRDNRLVRKKAAGKGNGQCYTSGECQKTGLSETQVVFCPKCKKKHYSAYALMNEFVNCECGYSFYAFADKGLHNLSRDHYDIKSKDLVRFVFQSCGWKKKLTYRVPGVRLAPDSHKVYFDLRQALEVHEGRTKPAY